MLRPGVWHWQVAQKRQVWRTPTIEKTLAPDWFESGLAAANVNAYQHVFNVFGSTAGLRVTCWDEDTFGRDNLGAVEMSLADITEWRRCVREQVLAPHACVCAWRQDVA